MFPDINICSLKSKTALVEKHSTKVFEDDGPSSLQLNIKWFRIQEPQKSLSKKTQREINLKEKKNPRPGKNKTY